MQRRECLVTNVPPESSGLRHAVNRSPAAPATGLCLDFACTRTIVGFGSITGRCLRKLLERVRSLLVRNSAAMKEFPKEEKLLRIRKHRSVEHVSRREVSIAGYTREERFQHGENNINTDVLGSFPGNSLCISDSLLPEQEASNCKGDSHRVDSLTDVVGWRWHILHIRAEIFLANGFENVRCCGRSNATVKIICPFHLRRDQLCCEYGRYVRSPCADVLWCTIAVLACQYAFRRGRFHLHVCNLHGLINETHRVCTALKGVRGPFRKHAPALDCQADRSGISNVLGIASPWK